VIQRQRKTKLFLFLIQHDAIETCWRTEVQLPRLATTKLEVNDENKMMYMRAMWNLPSLQQRLNIDGHISEEVRIFKYSAALIRGKNKISEKINTRTVAGSHYYYGSQHICKFKTIKTS
jgi:hypothetical protein